jgi:hypothetical protein
MARNEAVEDADSRFDESWGSEERASFVGVDASGLRRSSRLFSVVGQVSLFALVILGSVFSPFDDSGFGSWGLIGELFFGLAIGFGMGVLIQQLPPFLLFTPLIRTPQLIQQITIIAVRAGLTGMLVVIAAAGASDNFLAGLFLGLAGWHFLEPAVEHSAIVDLLKMRTRARRTLVLWAAQRSQIGLTDPRTIVGLSPTAVIAGLIARGSLAACLVSLAAMSTGLATAGLILWLVAEIVELTLLYVFSTRFATAAPVIAAVLLVWLAIASY